MSTHDLKAVTPTALLASLHPREIWRNLSEQALLEWQQGVIRIAIVLIGVYVLDTRKWRILLWLMPLAALAYPVSSVLLGAIVLSGVVMESRREIKEAILGFKYLAASSAFATVWQQMS